MEMSCFQKQLKERESKGEKGRKEEREGGSVMYQDSVYLGDNALEAQIDFSKSFFLFITFVIDNSV